MRLFKTQTKESVANSLSAFLPAGRIFESKGDESSTLKKYIIGLAGELFRLDEEMNTISQDYDINATTQFLEQWESAVGIPDDCMKATGTLTERRRDILAKLTKLNITTVQDFIDLGALFGIVITVTTGKSLGVFPLDFPVEFFPSAKVARFTMIITFPVLQNVFPLAFPLPFSSGLNALMQCLFSRVRPVNVNIVYRFA